MKADCLNADMKTLDGAEVKTYIDGRWSSQKKEQSNRKEAAILSTPSALQVERVINWNFKSFRYFLSIWIAMFVFLSLFTTYKEIFAKYLVAFFDIIRFALHIDKCIYSFLKHHS